MIKNENIKSIIKKYNENKMSHVFLVETNNEKLALSDLLEIVKVINCETSYEENCDKCNLCHLIAENTLPSLKIIYPDGQNIKKEQMESLKNDFASLPYFSKYNVYIINSSEKFNASSANTMLKFIEEPEKNIIGFLITNNKENVINTIKSRCELVLANYNEEIEEVDSKIYDLVINYIKNIEKVKEKSILYNIEFLNEKLEKEEIIDFFKIILNIYVDLLDNKIDKSLEFLENKKTEEILKKIELITDIINRLNYNVNINMLLDYFVLKMEELS